MLAFIVMSFLSLSEHYRYYYYFAIEGALFATGTFIALFEKSRGSIKYVLPLTVLAVSLSNSLTVIFDNSLIPVIPDNYRDVLVANSLTHGSLEDAQQLMSTLTPYYSLIPALPIDMSLLSIVTGAPAYTSYVILGIALSTALTLGIYVAIRKLTKDDLAAWLGAFILLSTPRLGVIGVIPQNISMAITAVFLLLLMMRLNKINLKHFVLFIFLLFGSLIYHSNGALITLAMLFSVIGITMIVPAIAPNLSNKMDIRSSVAYRLKPLLLVAIVVTLAYWSYNETAFSTISQDAGKLSISISNSTAVSTYVPPESRSEGGEIFAFSWALPLAISSAFVLVYLLQSFQKGPSILAGNRYWISLCAAILATSFGLVGFVSFVHNPEAANDRYMSVISYFLALVPSSTVLALILRSSKIYRLACLGIIASSVAIGSFSPELAPNEHKSFESEHPTYDAYLEVSQMEQYFPARSVVYFDNDIVEFNRLNSTTISIDLPQSYKTTRVILSAFGSGEFNLTQERVPPGRDLFFLIKTDRMQSTYPELLKASYLKDYNEINLVQSSGNHMTYLIESSLKRLHR